MLLVFSLFFAFTYYASMKNKDNNKNLRTLNISHKSSESELSLLKTLSYHSACMYNVALFSIRQAWFEDNKSLSWSKNYYNVKDNEHYSILMNDISQQVCKKAHHDFSSFLGLLNEMTSNKKNLLLQG